VFAPKMLISSRVNDYIVVDHNNIIFSPGWGQNRSNYRAVMAPLWLADGIEWSGNLRNPVAVKVASNGTPVIVPLSGDKVATHELVLMITYCPGNGAKRRPCFRVPNVPPNVQVLADLRTSGGSGWERWRLLIAPLGFAETVSSQCNDAKDSGENVIVF